MSERKRRDNGKNQDVIMPVSVSSVNLPKDYIIFLQSIKKRIETERLKTVLAANAAQILLYWDLGQDILQKQEKAGWGAKIIDRLSVDLRNEFPDMNGFSPRNLKYMRKFAQAWPNREFVQRFAAQIPWRNNQILLDKLKDTELLIWYAQQSIVNGWSRDILGVQIDNMLHKRVGQTANNFELTLPPLDSDMANQVFKDPYLFDFLGTAEIRKEIELEHKLINHLEKFLLELGQGFAFVGRQVHPEDKPTIGLLLVKEKNHTVVKYALTGNKCPIGVVEWEQKITESLPEELKSCLPSIEEIESELGQEIQG